MIVALELGSNLNKYTWQQGPILFVLSGCLGESRKLRSWLWNLVPTQAHMPENDVPKKLPSIL